jgi:hypothetical protein
MSEGKRGPGRPKKVQAEQAAEQSPGLPGDDEQAAGVDNTELQASAPVERAPDEIMVRVAKHFERNGVKVPIGTVFATRDTREIRRHIKHRCLEQVE